MKVKDILSYINSLAPFDTAAPWDNTGLIIGNGEDEVRKAVVCLDVTETELELAVKSGAQLIISHHPVIFKAQKNFLADNIAYKTAIIGLSVISAHTNLDKAAEGVNDALCRILKLDYEKIEAPVADGFLNVAQLGTVLCSTEFAKYLKEKLGGAVSYCSGNGAVTKLGIVSGSGADFLDEAIALGCDGFLTGDASYHDFLDAQAQGIALFAAGHFETEVIICNVLADKLKQKFTDTDFIVSSRKNPVFTVI